MGVDEENLLVLGVFVLGQFGGVECQAFVEMPLPLEMFRWVLVSLWCAGFGRYGLLHGGTV